MSNARNVRFGPTGSCLDDVPVYADSSLPRQASDIRLDGHTRKKRGASASRTSTCGAARLLIVAWWRRAPTGMVVDCHRQSARLGSVRTTQEWGGVWGEWGVGFFFFVVCCGVGVCVFFFFFFLFSLSCSSPSPTPRWRRRIGVVLVQNIGKGNSRRISC